MNGSASAPLYPEGIPVGGDDSSADASGRVKPDVSPDSVKITTIRIEERLAARNAELEQKLKDAREALVRLTELTLEGVDLLAHARLTYGSDFCNSEYDIEAEVKADQEAPFITEAFLYDLIGKEDARSVLSAVRALQRALEVPLGKRV
ncbi:hypothetical protein LCGC14_2153590 [marine sediment metagenome]|uniref:Uncharacterized protein n=1 Tax=marine sediment metagenome TaxID=412755 RepID=A0A0F9G7T6_9ZZZZ